MPNVGTPVSKQRRVDRGRALGVHDGGAAGQDHGLRAAAPGSPRPACVCGTISRVDAALAHAPGDELRVLRAEVDDQHRVGVGSGGGGQRRGRSPRGAYRWPVARRTPASAGHRHRPVRREPVARPGSGAEATSRAPSSHPSSPCAYRRRPAAPGDPRSPCPPFASAPPTPPPRDRPRPDGVRHRRARTFNPAVPLLDARPASTPGRRAVHRGRQQGPRLRQRAGRCADRRLPVLERAPGHPAARPACPTLPRHHRHRPRLASAAATATSRSRRTRAGERLRPGLGDEPVPGQPHVQHDRRRRHDLHAGREPGEPAGVRGRPAVAGERPGLDRHYLSVHDLADHQHPGERVDRRRLPVRAEPPGDQPAAVARARSARRRQPLRHDGRQPGDAPASTSRSWPPARARRPAGRSTRSGSPRATPAPSCPAPRAPRPARSRGPTTSSTARRRPSTCRASSRRSRSTRPARSTWPGRVTRRSRPTAARTTRPPTASSSPTRSPAWSKAVVAARRSPRRRHRPQQHLPVDGRGRAGRVAASGTPARSRATQPAAAAAGPRTPTASTTTAATPGRSPTRRPPTATAPHPPFTRTVTSGVVHDDRLRLRHDLPDLQRRPDAARLLRRRARPAGPPQHRVRQRRAGARDR